MYCTVHVLCFFSLLQELSLLFTASLQLSLFESEYHDGSRHSRASSMELDLETWTPFLTMVLASYSSHHLALATPTGRLSTEARAVHLVNNDTPRSLKSQDERWISVPPE